MILKFKTVVENLKEAFRLPSVLLPYSSVVNVFAMQHSKYFELNPRFRYGKKREKKQPL